MRSLILLTLLLFTVSANAKVDVTDRFEEPNKVVGKKAAQKFFKKEPAAAASRDHFLALHVGGFIESTAYKWGSEDQRDNPARSSMGLSYRIGEWTSLMDLLVRVDFNTYELAQGRAVKMSLLPLVLFPEVNSEFPLYFGIGVGPGVYFRQVEDSSNLALDYQLVAGARFFNVLENTGFFVEGGLKNHLHLLGLGQFNGSYAALGVLFSF